MSTTVSSSTVDGLISGLDTSSIISQLLTADAAPQTQLKNTVSSAQLKVTAYQSVNTKMAALQTAGEALKRATGWTPTTATSSSTAITVTANATASTGSAQISVVALAAGRSAVSAPFSVLPGATLNPATLGYPMDVVRSDGSYVTIQPSAGTLEQVVDAINVASEFGIKAVAIRVGADSYRLQITSTKTGEVDGDFKVVPHASRATSTLASPLNINTNSPVETWASLTTESTGWATLAAADDAEVTLGVGGGAITAKSKTNTFVGLMPGVTMTVGATTPPGTPATVAVNANPTAIANAMQAMVTAANAALDEITMQSRAGAASSDGKVTGGGTLRGDSIMRSLKSGIIEAATSVLGASQSGSTYGLQSTKEGKLTFDKETFLAAYAKDPAKAQELLAPSTLNPLTTSVGAIERLVTVAKGATDITGSLTTAIEGQNKSISTMQDRIADWNVRLAQKKERYQSYYAALESSLGKLKSQSSWLAGQLSSLNS